MTHWIFLRAASSTWLAYDARGPRVGAYSVRRDWLAMAPRVVSAPTWDNKPIIERKLY